MSVSEPSEPIEQTVRKLLDENWDTSKRGFKPIISTGWYDSDKEDEPQVTVRTGPTTPTFIVIDSKIRELSELIEINVWTIDEAKRFRMVHEVDNIIEINRVLPGSGLATPVTGLIFAWVSSWVPLDEPDKRPTLLRTRLFAAVQYYKTSTV